MSVLALELSSPVGSIAFCGANGAPVFKGFPADRKDSGLFYENLQSTLVAAEKPDVIVVGLGPGSYAGVRIAIATALGLKAATGASLIGLPSICALARPEYVIVGDARRNSFFFAHIVGGRCVEGPTLGTEEQTAAKLQESSELPRISTQSLPQFVDIIVEHPSALRLAELTREMEIEDSNELEPIYLRAPYITVAKK